MRRETEHIQRARDRACAAMRDQAQPKPNGHPRSNQHTDAEPIRTLEPYRSFPIEALQAPLAEYARQAAAALGCDPAYMALPALSVAAGLIGNTRAIRLKRTWIEPCVVWSAIVGETGTLKSPAYLIAVAYLFRLQKRLREEFKLGRARYLERLQEYKAAKHKAKNEGPDPGDPPKEPVLQRVVCSDCTIEKLAEILEDNPRGILFARDELAAWPASFQRYKGKSGGTDLPNWLEMHRAGPVIVDRKTGERPSLFVERAAVSVAGGIQPGVLAKALTPEFLDAGLGARLLLAMPAAPPKRWSETEVHPDIETAYHDTLDKLLSLEFGHDNKGEKVPHVLQLTAEAKDAWVKFYDQWAREQASVEGELAAAFSKLEAYAARFVLIHHVATHVSLDTDDLRPISSRSVEAGIALCEWFAGEARRIYATLSETTQERDIRKLVELIGARGGRISARLLQRTNSRKYPTAAHAEAALEALVVDSLASWEEPSVGPQGGQPARYLKLHPTHDTTDTTSPGDDGDSAAAHDTSADSTGPNPGLAGENLGSVGTVMRRTENLGTTTGNARRGGSVGQDGVVSDGSARAREPGEEG
jgi:hypothetical protein